MKHLVLILISFISAVSLQAQAVFQSSNSAIGASGPAIITRPAATALNDLLVVSVTYEKGSSEVLTAPAGWALILRTDNLTNCGLSTYYKIAGASEPASYSFALANGSKWSIGISRISNVNTSTPIEAFNGATGLGAAVDAPSVNILGSSRLVLCTYTNKKASTYTPSAGTTERYDAPNTAGGLPSNMMASFSAGVGATPTQTATAVDPESWSAQQIAITPATAGTLPVKFTSYNVVKNNNDYQVSWSTSEEINSAYFDVERSENGNNWKAVARINAAGTASSVQSYSHTDRNVALKSVHYRVKQVDADSKVAYTAIRTFTNNAVQPVTISNTQSKISIRFADPVKGSVQVHLINMNGQTISSKTYTASSLISVSAPASVKGLFIVQVRYNATESISQKLIF